MSSTIISLNSDFQHFGFCDFDPGPSLGVYRKGPLIPWSRSSLLRSDEKVIGHSKNTYLQHCIWYLINFPNLSRSVPIFHVSLSFIYLLFSPYHVLYTRFFLNICKRYALKQYSFNTSNIWKLFFV